MEEKQYFNYHKHSYYSNIITTDCVVSYDEYADRTKELGHKWLSCCEHGGTFAWAECYNIAKKHNLKFVCVGEFYFVEDRKKEFEIIGGKNKSTRRDNSNYHMVLVAKTQNAMRELNYIMSKAFEDGFYYKPRIDLELLRGLPKGEVYCTTACIAGFLRDYEKNKHILKELIDIFGDNLFLEVQCHNTESQIEYNKLLKNLSKEYGLKLIAGVDSHMISLDDTKLRDYLLHSKGIVYEDEQGWLNDYPSYNTLKDRFLTQGIWNEIEVENFIDNTLLLTNTDEIVINTKMKVPTIFPDKTREWRLGHLKGLIFNKWNEYKNNFTKEEQELYYKELLAEYSVIEETKMEDYFLSNYYIIKRGKELGGVLTKTGRGCFVGDTQVWTTSGYKAIKDVKIGDIVINKNGEFDKVINTLKYNIEEDLVKIHSIGNKDITLTKDHKIYVYDSVVDKFVYKKAIDINIKTDFLTTPINLYGIKNKQVYDLSKYNTGHFDDKYIYEKNIGTNSYKKNHLYPAHMRKVGISTPVQNLQYRNNELKEDSIVYKRIKEYTKMNPSEYSDYLEKYSYTNKISRFIKNDSELMFILGIILGDGNFKEKSNQINIYLNTDGIKDRIARPRIEKFLNRYNINYLINVPNNNKKMIIISIKSHSLKNMLRNEFKIYKNRVKYIDIKNIIENNDLENLKGLLEGLLYSDGSFEKSKDCKNTRYVFDNTSPYLTSLYNILCYAIIKKPLSRTFDSRNKSLSVKSRTCRRSSFVKENYICSKIFSKETVKGFKGSVYDLTIEKDPSFIVENSIVHNSASSYLTNFMLGFTSVDRLQHKIPMLRERFMGKARIIDNNSSPDIDFNLWNRDAFIQAQDELLGYQGNYFMVAYGTLGVKSAFKMLCRAKEIPIETADEVSKLISAYEKDKKHNDSVELEDYIKNKEYLNLVNASKVYTGIIDSFSVSPCSFILFNGDLRREIGLIRDKNGNMMTCITGVQAEKFGYLKNELLIVKVVGMNHELYNRIGMEQPDSAVLEEWIKDDENVWDLYGKGFTQCLNQVESSGTTSKCINYQPKTFEELCAFIAVIRPASAGIYKSFERREDFKYNIKDVDNILRGEYLSGSWLIYQEQMMQLLQFLGFPDSEAYSVMKAISKKKEAVIEGIKSKFEENMTKKIIEDLLEKKGEN